MTKPRKPKGKVIPPRQSKQGDVGDAAKAKRLSPPSSARLRLGPGMFGVDPRAAESAEQAYSEATRLLTEGDADVGALNWLEPALKETARYYWANHDGDVGVTFGEIKVEILSFTKTVQRTLQAIDELSVGAKRVINFSATQSEITTGDPGDPGVAGKAKNSIENLISTIAKLTKPTYARQSNAAIEQGCSSLWAIWEKSTGRKFVRNWDKASGKSGNDVFVYQHTAFVQFVMQAIDPVVLFPQVEAALRNVARTKSIRNDKARLILR